MKTLLLDSWLATLEDEMPLKQEIQALKEALEKAEHELSILKPKLDDAAGFNLHELVIENDNQSLENFVLKEKLSVAQSKLGEKTELEDVGELMQHRTRLITVANQALEAFEKIIKEMLPMDSRDADLGLLERISDKAIEALKKELNHE